MTIEEVMRLSAEGLINAYWFGEGVTDAQYDYYAWHRANDTTNLRGKFLRYVGLPEPPRPK